MFRNAYNGNCSSTVAAVDTSVVAADIAVETVAPVELAEFVAVENVEFSEHRFGQLETRRFSTNKVVAVRHNRFDYFVARVVVERILFRKICKNSHRNHFVVRSCGKAYLLY